MQQPLVSIIIPCFNHGLYLEEAVRSAIKQDYKQIEVIVVNDGSDDEHTIDVLKKLTQTENVIVVQQLNAGPCTARNTGINLSKGDYLVFLDADDVLLPHFIKNAVNAMLSGTNIGVVFGDLKVQENDTVTSRKQIEFDIDTLLTYNPIALCSLVSKQAILDCKGFDETLNRKGLEDWELWIHMTAKKWQFLRIDQPSFKINVLNNSRTYAVANPHVEEVKAYISSKHHQLFTERHHALYYQNRMLQDSLPQKVGDIVLSPYRLIKKLFTQNKG